MMKITPSKRAYHKRVLQEVAQMLRSSGVMDVAKVKPVKHSDLSWAERKVQALVKA